MSAVTKTRAIVLNNRKYGEADIIATFLTAEYGLVSGLAKGALKSLKRFAGSLEPFTLVELRFVLKTDALARVEGAEIIAANHGIREDLDRIQASSALAELAMAMEPPLQERGEVFRLVETGLGAIGKSDRPLELMTVYILKYMDAAGFGIETGTCSSCGGRISGGAGYRGGEGLLCKRCAGPGGVKLDAGIIAFMNGALAVDESKAGRLRIPAASLGEFNRFLSAYIRAVTGRELRSLRPHEPASFA